MTREEAQLIAAAAARQAADQAVTEMLLKLGIDVEDSAAVVQFQQDFGAMRDFVRTYRDVRSKGFAAMVILVLTAALGAFWVGVRSSIH